MSNNQVDRLEVGTVYEWRGRRLTFTQVMGPTRFGGWYALDGAGQPWSGSYDPVIGQWYWVVVFP